MDDKLALRMSQAGMRFIAQMTIYNSGDFQRLQTYVAESYRPELLADLSADARVVEFQEQQRQLGKVKVYQVLGMSKHHVIILLETELDETYWLSDLTVEEDYPHKIMEYSFTPLS